MTTERDRVIEYFRNKDLGDALGRKLRWSPRAKGVQVVGPPGAADRDPDSVELPPCDLKYS